MFVLSGSGGYNRHILLLFAKYQHGGDGGTTDTHENYIKGRRKKPKRQIGMVG